MANVNGNVKLIFINHDLLLVNHALIDIVVQQDLKEVLLVRRHSVDLQKQNE